MIRHPPRKVDVIISLLKMLRQPTAHVKKTGGGIPSKKPRELDSMVLEPPTTATGVGLEIRGDSKTVVDLINGHAKQKKRQSELLKSLRNVDYCLCYHVFRLWNVSCPWTF